MISDAIPWKEELLRVARSIEQRTTQRRWTERTTFLVERNLMNAGYAIRRLNEARRISDNLAAQPIPVQMHMLTGGPIDIWNRGEYWEHFDMDNPQTVELSLTEFTNQLIHSWVWSLSSTESPPYLFNGVFVASDWASKKHLYFFSASTLIELFHAVGDDHVVSSLYQRDSKGIMHITRASTAQDCPDAPTPSPAHADGIRNEEQHP